MQTITDVIKQNITVFNPATGEVLEANIQVDEDLLVEGLIKYLQERRLSGAKRYVQKFYVDPMKFRMMEFNDPPDKAYVGAQPMRDNLFENFTFEDELED